MCHFEDSGFWAYCVIGITENSANALSRRISGDGKLTVHRQDVGNLTPPVWHNETICMRLSAMVRGVI
jgi:hypothetical protein